MAITPVGWFLINLAIQALFVGYSIAARPRGKDRRTDGFGIDLRTNPSDPSEPIPLVYGAPRTIPPVLTRFVRQKNLNSISPVTGEIYVVGLSLGAGPIDLRGLSVEMNDEQLSEAVTTASPADLRTLRAVDSARRRFVFPKRHVVRDSVVVYAGANVYAFANGGDPTETTELSYNDTPAAKTYSKWTSAQAASPYLDEDIPVSTTYYGFPVNRDHVVVPGSVTAAAIRKPGGGGSGGIRFGSGAVTTAKEPAAKPEDIHLDRASDGSPYVWVDVRAGGTFIDKFRVTYRYRLRLASIEQDADGTAYATFREDVPAATEVTASYRTSNFGDHVKVTLRDGSSDQEPIPADDGIRNTFTVAAELAQGTPRRYSSVNDVNDLLVGIESGPAGFYDSAVAGQNAGDYRPTKRKVQIRLKTSDASDIAGVRNDPATGWITLLDATLEGNVKGTARWWFSCADLLAQLRGTAAGQTGNSLPLAQYDVEAITLDKANADSAGAVVDRIQSTLFFGSVTEIVWTRLPLPYHATAWVEVDDLKLIPQEPVFSITYAGRLVWVPDDSAAYSSTTGRPEPGTWKWSRNPVWCACDLLTNATFGAGDFFTWQHIDLASAIDAANFCDETATNLDHTSETRSEIDIVLGRRSAILDHVAQMLQGARVMPTLDGGTWKFVTDEDASASLAIDDGDIALGSISSSYVGIEDVPTELDVATTLEENDYELHPVPIQRDGTPPTQRQVRRIDLSGVRRRTQVERHAALYLRQMNEQRLALQFVAAGWRPLALTAGQIVTLTSAALGFTAKKFRVVGLGLGSNLNCRVSLAEHVPEVYRSLPFQPSSAIVPGLRPPSDTPTQAPAPSTTPQNQPPTETLPTKFSMVKVTPKGKLVGPGAKK